MINRGCFYFHKSKDSHCYGQDFCVYYSVLFSEIIDDNKTYTMPDCSECKKFKKNRFRELK